MTSHTEAIARALPGSWVPARVQGSTEGEGLEVLLSPGANTQAQLKKLAQVVQRHSLAVDVRPAACPLGRIMVIATPVEDRLPAKGKVRSWRVRRIKTARLLYEPAAVADAAQRSGFHVIISSIASDHLRGDAIDPGTDHSPTEGDRVVSYRFGSVFTIRDNVLVEGSANEAATQKPVTLPNGRESKQGKAGLLSHEARSSAFAKATEAALERHADAGRAVPVWRGGRVVWVDARTGRKPRTTKGAVNERS